MAYLFFLFFCSLIFTCVCGIVRLYYRNDN